MNEKMKIPYPVKIKSLPAGGEKRMVAAGPCIIENYDMLERTAGFLQDIADQKKVNIILKISYEKANRTSGNSFTGPGLEEGVKMIKKLKKKITLPVLVDIHCSREAEKAAEVADSLQIPAFLCRQTKLIEAAGETGLPLNIKKGQFMDPGAMLPQGLKALSSGSPGVILTERGTFFGYGDLVVDMRSILIMKSQGFPVLFDATHSQQQPPSGDGGSGGSTQFTVPLARAALAAGADGIYAEVHPDPRRAKSDSGTQLDFKGFRELIDAVQ